MSPSLQQWQKVLYKGSQGRPDNYTSDTFLELMTKNVNFTTYDYWTVVRGSGVVSQQASSIAIFVAIYILLYEEFLSPYFVLLATLFVVVAVIIICWIVGSKVIVGIKRGGIFVALTLLGLSPVIHTLAETISTDTIYAMTVCMLTLNVLFCDYSPLLSLNTALFAAVCLASQLKSSLHTFTLCIVAIVIFALYPRLRLMQQPLATAGSCFFAFILLLYSTSADGISAWLFGVTVLAITFLGPYVLVHVQHYKDEIKGPWDEAVPS